jgi:hypothetical protein
MKVKTLSKDVDLLGMNSKSNDAIMADLARYEEGQHFTLKEKLGMSSQGISHAEIFQPRRSILMQCCL